MPRLVNGLEQIFTSLGIVGAGYKLFFFATTTTTPKTTYSDLELTTANPNPVVCDANGRPEFDIWGGDPATYKMVLGTPDSVIGNINPIVTIDPVDDLNSDSIINLDPLPAAYWGTTTGTSTNYLLDALVPISSYSNKQCFFVDFHIANAAAPTLDVNDIGVINLKKYTGQGTKVALAAGDVQAQRYLVIIDGVDAVVLNPRTQMLYLGSPPALAVSSNILTLTNAASSYNIDTSSGAQTINTINGLVSGQTVVIGISSNTNAATITNGAGNIVNPYGISAVLNSVNDKITIYNDGTNNIIIASGANRNFLSSKASNGYSYLPNGVIEQWGSTATIASGGGTVAVTFPVAFPNAALNLQQTWLGAPSPDNGIDSPQNTSLTTTGFTAVNKDPDSSAACFWYAKGH